jgi:CsoR family transcriptional regulator, copper-sensing transcriptional repressor
MRAAHDAHVMPPMRNSTQLVTAPHKPGSPRRSASRFARPGMYPLGVCYQQTQLSVDPSNQWSEISGAKSVQQLATTPGYSANKRAVQQRLRRIEGQVRGLQRMVNDDEYCIDVLTQISAATRALQAVALELLEDHLGHCVSHAITAGGPEADLKIREAAQAVARLVKS